MAELDRYCGRCGEWERTEPHHRCPVCYAIWPEKLKERIIPPQEAASMEETYLMFGEDGVLQDMEVDWHSRIRQYPKVEVWLRDKYSYWFDRAWER